MASQEQLNLDAWKSDGTPLLPVRTGASRGVTLGVATYYFELPSQVASERSCSAFVRWASAVAATITLEVTNLEDVSSYAAQPDWVQVNPSTAYVPVSGSGNSATLAAVTAGGSAAGACTFDLTDVTARRIRIKVVATVGGLMRVAANEKRQ